MLEGQRDHARGAGIEAHFFNAELVERRPDKVHPLGGQEERSQRRLRRGFFGGEGRRVMTEKHALIARILFMKTTERISVGLCPHFGTCGGCASQDVSYKDQLSAKESRLAELLAPFDLAIRPIIPSPDEFFYRNKMEFAFGGLKDM